MANIVMDDDDNNKDNSSPVALDTMNDDDEPLDTVSTTSTFDEQELLEMVAAAEANIAAEEGNDDLTPLQTSSSEEFDQEEEKPAKFADDSGSSSEGSLDMPPPPPSPKKTVVERSDVGSPWTLASSEQAQPPQQNDSKRSSQSGSPWETPSPPSEPDADAKKAPPLSPSMKENDTEKVETDKAFHEALEGDEEDGTTISPKASLDLLNLDTPDPSMKEEDATAKVDETDRKLGQGDEQQDVSPKASLDLLNLGTLDTKQDKDDADESVVVVVSADNENDTATSISPKASLDLLHLDTPESPPVPQEKKSMDLLCFHDDPAPPTPPIRAPTPPTLDLLDVDAAPPATLPEPPVVEDLLGMAATDVLEASQEAVDSLFEKKPAAAAATEEQPEENPWLVSPDPSVSISRTQSKDDSVGVGVGVAAPETVKPPFSPVQEEYHVDTNAESSKTEEQEQSNQPLAFPEEPTAKTFFVSPKSMDNTDEMPLSPVPSMTPSSPATAVEANSPQPQESTEKPQQTMPPPAQSFPTSPAACLEQHVTPDSRASPTTYLIPMNASTGSAQQVLSSEGATATTTTTVSAASVPVLTTDTTTESALSSSSPQLVVSTGTATASAAAFAVPPVATSPPPRPKRERKLQLRNKFFPSNDHDHSSESSDDGQAHNLLRYTSMEDEESPRVGGGPPKQQLHGSRNAPQASLMAKTRSRATVDLVTVDTATTASGLTYNQQVATLDEDDNAFILNAAIAKKRVGVVQLLVIGLLGIGLGLFGSLYVLSSCYFLTAEAPVGENHAIFEVRYGFWKYTPIESVFDGYSYCTAYNDNQYNGNAPWVSRVCSIVAILLGMFALTVLWYYLITGRAKLAYWKWSVRMLVMAGCMQALTFYMFADDVCLYHTCHFGPGAGVSIAVVIGWFLLAYEMHTHTPVSALVQELNPDDGPVNMVANLEPQDFQESAKSYVSRLMGKNDTPSLNQIQRMRGGTPRNTTELEMASHAPYRPPVFV